MIMIPDFLLCQMEVPADCKDVTQCRKSTQRLQQFVPERNSTEFGKRLPCPHIAQAFESVGMLHQTRLHQRCIHISNAGISKKNNNNVQERFNGTLRSIQRPRRGIKSKNSPSICRM